MPPTIPAPSSVKARITNLRARAKQLSLGQNKITEGIALALADAADIMEEMLELLETYNPKYKSEADTLGGGAGVSFPQMPVGSQGKNASVPVTKPAGDSRNVHASLDTRRRK